jgi:hypothetical protein
MFAIEPATPGEIALNLSSGDATSRRDASKQAGAIEVAVLEAVEDLLERELHTAQHTAM